MENNDSYEIYGANWTDYFLNFLETNEKLQRIKENRMQIKWADSRPQQGLHVADLQVNEAFRLVTGEAVYIKVDLSHLRNGDYGLDYCMLEVASGKVFKPSQSGVERIKVEMTVGVPKPKIY